MPEERPVVDRTVAKAPGLGLLGIALVLAALGLIIVGARTAASLFRTLDQGAVERVSSEQSPQAAPAGN